MRGREVHLITKELEIGRPVAHPTLVAEWDVCTVWNLETQQGLFLVKCFNPRGGISQEMKERYNFGEAWARELEKMGAPVLPALAREEEAFLEIYGQGFLILSLENLHLLENAWGDEIGVEVGRLLGKIHARSTFEESLKFPHGCSDGEQSSAEMRSGDETDGLHKILCHGALTPEKILKRENGELVIAHWEELYPLPPLAEALSVAVIWGQEEDKLDEEKVEAILRAYQEGGGNLQASSPEEAKKAWLFYQERRWNQNREQEEGQDAEDEEGARLLSQWDQALETACEVLRGRIL